MKPASPAVSPSRSARTWAPLAIATGVVILTGLVSASGQGLRGRSAAVNPQPAVAVDPAPLFYRFGKHYLNVERISHVIDEPGYNMPPGSLQVFYDGNSNWVALYGEDAEAFRQLIGDSTTVVTGGNEKPPLGGATKPAAKPAGGTAAKSKATTTSTPAAKPAPPPSSAPVPVDVP